MKYIIHRGITSTTIKENTYESIKLALDDKETVGVEFDIRLTKDNQIILYHNDFINSQRIEDMNYIDIIKEINITTLDKILTINTNKILLIDIKVHNNYKLFGNTLLKHLNNINKNIYLSSFDKKIVKYLQNKTNHKVGLISFFYKIKDYGFIVINHFFISPQKIKKIKNKEIFLFTIKNEKELEKVKKKFSDINDYYLIIDKKDKFPKKKE